MSIIKRLVILCLVAVIVLMATGCQSTPENAVVTSKSDGAFEAALETDADVQTETENSQVSPATYTDSFTNTDGDISFQVELDVPVITADTPVLRVRPKTISAECAKHVAEVLFGNADIYEHSENWSKAKLEEMILDLRQRLANQETMEEYYGAMGDTIAEQIESVIVKYESAYAVAPETTKESLCAWEFHPRSWYYDQAWVDADDPEEISNNKSNWIVADSERDGLPYIYSVCNRDEEDYRMQSITCEINWNLVDSSLFYSSRMPSEEELAETRAVVESMLEMMDIGEWVIESCIMREIPTFDGSEQYEIVVTACPVYNGVKVIRQKQLENLRTEDAYASNYYYEEAIFSFSGGNLVNFQYRSPLEVVDVVNEDVAILSFEEAMEKCKSQLQMSILTEDAFYDRYQPVGKKVEVYQVELGLVRTRVKNSSTDFYLLPAYTFRAFYELYDQNDTLVFESKVLEPAGLIAKELLVISAVDGSIINTQLGY